MKLQLKTDLWQDYLNHSFNCSNGDTIVVCRFSGYHKGYDIDDGYTIYNYEDNIIPIYSDGMESNNIEELHDKIKLIHGNNTELVTRQSSHLHLYLGDSYSCITIGIIQSEVNTYIATQHGYVDKEIDTCDTLQGAKDSAENYVCELIGDYFEII